MKNKGDIKEPNDKGYGMIFAREVDSLNRKLNREEVLAVAFNVLQYIAGIHDYNTLSSEELTQRAEMIFSEIIERIDRNIKHSKCRPYGAPEGNKNAVAKDKPLRLVAVEKLIDEGLTERAIAERLGLARSTVHDLKMEINKRRSIARNNISKTGEEEQTDGGSDYVPDDGMFDSIEEYIQSD